jgi:hypothetical protein
MNVVLVSKAGKQYNRGEQYDTYNLWRRNDKQNWVYDGDLNSNKRHHIYGGISHDKNNIWHYGETHSLREKGAYHDIGYVNSICAEWEDENTSETS